MGLGAAMGGSFSPIGPNPNGRATSSPPPHTHTQRYGAEVGGGEMRRCSSASWGGRRRPGWA